MVNSLLKSVLISFFLCIVTAYAQDPEDIVKKISKANAGRGTFEIRKNTYFADLNKAEIKIFFSTEDLKSILKTGEFQNSHETGASRGHEMSADAYESKIVSKIENAIAGKDITDNELRPKYGIVDFPDFYQFQAALDWDISDPDAGVQFSDSYKSAQYGEMIAVMKGPVKNRTTVSFKDSGDFKKQVSRNKNADLSRHFTGLGGKEKFPINARELNGARYIEAQIWGKLALNDVDYFILNVQGMDKKQVQSVMESVAKTGIPMYEQIVLNDYHHVIPQTPEEAAIRKSESWMKKFEYYGKGRVIFEGDASVRKAFMKTVGCDVLLKKKKL